MRPVIALSGAPFSGGLAGAVRLEPEGLTLNTPATLEIEPPDGPPPADRRIGFTADGDGRDLHLLSAATGDALSLQLLHFSIPGVGDGSSVDAQMILDRMPSDSTAIFDRIAGCLRFELDFDSQLTLDIGAPLFGGYTSAARSMPWSPRTGATTA